MAPFAMCAACAAEYHDPADRRFHAEPVCCPACGPRLSLAGSDGGRSATARPKDVRAKTRPGPLEEAVGLLRGGGILAVKGLGGYHLACDAADEDAVARHRLGSIADAFLSHDRPIHRRCEDSVVRAAFPVRRSRGYVPVALQLPVPAARPLVAAGPELKATFCVARGAEAFLSPH